MFIQRTKRKSGDKVYHSVALLENYRDGKRVRHRTIATLTKWPEHIVNDLERLLKKKAVVSLDDLEFSNGKSFGAIEAVKQIAQKLGITQALGKNKQGQLALFQIAGRIITQGSGNYLANEWVKNQAVDDVFKLDKFNEDDLYENLDRLSDNQQDIEKKIFNYRYKNKKIRDIFLYDVTSSYLEGEKNELSEYGYNRDKKKGKKQIVVGLMLDTYGYPVTVEVFKGNTADTKTVSSQLKKLKDLFGVERVVFVGDKGMIKSSQIDEIISDSFKWNYLTTISRKQIRTLIKKDIIQLSLFDDEVMEVEGEGNIRYILRKNKIRAEELKKNREERVRVLKEYVKKKNSYLQEHTKANEDIALRDINKKISKLKLKKFISIAAKHKRFFQVITDEEAKEKDGELDGCYVIQTELSRDEIDKNTAHDRYKDLAKVEFAFRTIKTTIEEIRPIYVRKEKRTRGHVFVVMLAYMIIKYITDKTQHLNYTRKFIIDSLDKIHYIEYYFKNQRVKTRPDRLNAHQQELVSAIGVELKVAKNKSADKSS